MVLFNPSNIPPIPRYRAVLSPQITSPLKGAVVTPSPLPHTEKELDSEEDEEDTESKQYMEFLAKKV